MNRPVESAGRKTATKAERVARRALVLTSVACRGSIETGADQPEARDLYRRLLEWLTQTDLWCAVEPKEAEALRAVPGQLEEERQIRAGWAIEGASILAWALGEFALPPHDQKVDPYDVADAVGFLSDEVASFVQASVLRKRKELVALRELMYAIHVRLRDFLRHRKRKDFTDWVEAAWLDTLRLDAASLIAEGDLAIEGKPISLSTETRIQECSWIAFERHRAIIWLVERYPNYTQTPVDT